VPSGLMNVIFGIVQLRTRTWVALSNALFTR
jgi:hypothetical protein